MPRVRTFSIYMTRMAAAFALTLATALPTGAAELWYPASFSSPAGSEWAFRPLDTPRTYSGEIGARLWFGRARTAKDLFDDTGAVLISRLDYYKMNIITGEVFARLESDTGWFVKGYTGGGWLAGGQLKDEDFPPVIDPYSATLSDQRDGAHIYGSVDAGVTLIRGADFHLAAFVGYHFMRDHMTARGCEQIGTNPAICGAPGIPTSVRVITQKNDWHALRLGVEASVEFDRWKLGVDAAWLPIAQLNGYDAHWLRIGPNIGDFASRVPEDGGGWGYQIDAFLSYRYSEQFTVGVGGRYWYVESKGHTHFEGHIVGGGGVPQVLKWKAEHFGVFVQSSFKFGPYPLVGQY